MREQPEQKQEGNQTKQENSTTTGMYQQTEGGCKETQTSKNMISRNARWTNSRTPWLYNLGSSC